MTSSYATLSAAVEAQHADGHAPFRVNLAHLLDQQLPAFLLWETLSFTFRDAEGNCHKTYRIASEAIRADAQRKVVDDEEERLLALLRRVPAQRPSKRTADTALIHVARKVADWTKEHGPRKRADWQATVRILEWHGWELPGASLAERAQRLEDRVTRYSRRNP